MSGRKKRAFGLDYSLHTSFFEVKSNCAGGEGLVGDVSKSFGDLDCILCLPSGDKVDCMANIGRGKFLWTTTRGLVELRTLFGAKFRDGRDMNASSGCNRVGRMTSIKLSEDGVLLSRREGSHDDGG